MSEKLDEAIMHNLHIVLNYLQVVLGWEMFDEEGRLHPPISSSDKEAFYCQLNDMREELASKVEGWRMCFDDYSMHKISDIKNNTLDESYFEREEERSEIIGDILLKELHSSEWEWQSREMESKEY